MKSPVLLAQVLLLGFCSHAAAAEILNLQVDHAGGRYFVNMRVLLDASAPRAYAVFADPHNLSAINPAVQDMQIEPGDVLFTQVRVCAGLFCKTIHQVQSMHYEPRNDGGHIDAQIQPASGNLRSGSARWDFLGVGLRTQLDFVATIEPDFWIPPLLGPWLVENSMREEAERTSRGIERLANQRP